MLENSFDSAKLFKGRHFDSSIIILCVRCYITYKLSYRDLRDMMAERGINLAHAHNPEMGTALRSRVRNEVESICSPRRHVLESG